jgi:hypothetical protein
MSISNHQFAEGIGYLCNGTHASVDEATQKQESPRASRQELRGSKNDVRNISYHAERLSCTGKHQQRTDIRTLDDHATWREVARANHVEPGR